MNKKIILKSAIFLLIISFVSITAGGMLIYNNENKANSNIVLEDNIPPTLINVSIKSTSKKNLSYAEKGDEVILSFEADEDLKYLPTVEINSKIVDAVKIENKYIATYVVEEQYDKESLISFKIYNYGDASGNMGSEVITTSDLSKVYISAENKEVSKVLITSISLNKTSLHMIPGETFEVKVTVNPSNAVYDNIKWKSSNEKVATVKDGIIEAISSGYTEVSVNIDQFSEKIGIWVEEKKIEVTSIKFKCSSDSIDVGDILKLEPIVSPSNATNVDIKWSSSNKNIATVVDGTVVAKSPGNVIITATTGNIYVEKK